MALALLEMMGRLTTLPRWLQPVDKLNGAGPVAYRES